MDKHCNIPRCENCRYGVDYGESVQFIKCEKCEKGHIKYVDKKQEGCECWQAKRGK